MDIIEFFLYLLLGVILYFFEFYYIKFAKKNNILDIPNDRSSHTSPIVRGGGIIIYLSSIIYFFISGFHFPWFMLGLTIIFFISFVDDIKPFFFHVKLPVHFIVIALLLYQYGLFYSRWQYAVIALFGCVGIINAFNFMDGINGITCGYSFITLSTLLYINNYVFRFVDPVFIYISIVPILILAIFNFRKNAKCFIGDVGSMSIAYIILFLLGILILYSREFTYILFLAVYGVDTILTIYHRIMLKENILLPHRKHAYQIMANELKIPHVYVSLIYMGIQLIINIGLFIFFEYKYIYLILVFVILSLIYIIFMKKYFKLHINMNSQVNK